MSEMSVTPLSINALIKEIEFKEIKAEYIDYIFVLYNDNTFATIPNEDILYPFSINSPAYESVLKNKKDIKVYLKTEKIEKALKEKVSAMFNYN